MSHEIAGTCRCNLCGEKFTGPVALIVGSGLSRDNARVAQFSLKLAQHFIEKHAQENNAVQMKSLEFLGMLRLANFTTTDKGIIEQRDFLRWRVHQATLAGTLPDAKLQEAAKDFSSQIVDMCVASLVLKDPEKPEPAHVAPVTATLKEAARELIARILFDLRETLQEPGRYNMTASAPANSETAPTKVRLT